MKPIYLLILSLLPAAGLQAQQGSKDRNYRTETVVRQAGITDARKADSLSITECMRKFSYYDGFGYPLQEVSVGAAKGMKDLVQHKYYDAYRRESRSYLPYADSGVAGGQFRTEAEAETRAYYADSLRSGMTPTDFPYAETVFEQSQLDRILEQGAPGEIWQPAAERNHTTGRTVRTGYGTCTSSEQDAVKLFVLTAEGITYQSDYPAGSLMKTVLKDENWTSGADGTVETYTDNEGRTVLERRIHTDTKGTEHLDTYYVYDDLNRLRYVLPPQAEEIFRQAGETRSGSDKGIADYAYVYRYDGNGNCISKKMPGSEEVEMVYDKARRRVLSRDGKCRKEGKWMFWLYEETGRQAVQGICTNPDVEALKNDTVTTRWTDRGILAGYEAPGTLGQDIQLLKADYYDYYAFLDDEELLPENRQEYGKVYPDTQKPDAAGLKTGTASYAADGSGTLTGMEVLYYDSFGRCVQKRLKNHLGETDEEYTAYTFTGLPRLVMRVHRSPDQEERKEMLRYEYDTMDRLLKVYFRLDDKEEELVCDNVYDDLGRIVTDRRNGTDNLRTGYTYNIRNWMTSIESPLFKEELHYTDGTGTPCYNGNISSISWKAGEEQATRGYRFTYDGLDRMKTAEYGEGERLAVNPNRFNEEVTAYDKTGNILGIRRMGQTGAQEYGLVNNLVLTYSGNQLTKVTDNAASSAYNNGFEFKDGADRETEYIYDENGNLTQDLNRNIKDIQYNFLNLPQRIEFEDGSTTEYLYDAEGRKLRTVHRADGKTTTTDYVGNLIYENGNPIRLITGYGYVSLPDGMYHYYLQDHQGNNRVVADRNGKVEEVNHYYPFGGMFAHTGNVQPYKYNGKELDTQKGLNWYDYGARHYDPAVGRWHVQDPMQEKYYNTSQYAYCANNPVKYIDPNGKEISPYYDMYGNFLGADNEGFTGNIKITTPIQYASAKSTDNFEDNPAMMNIEDAGLSAKSLSNIFTHILEQTGYPSKMLINERVAVKGIIEKDEFNSPQNVNLYSTAFTLSPKSKFKIKVNYGHKQAYHEMRTVENVQNVLGDHEYMGHGIHKWRDVTNTHHKVYEYQMSQPSFKKVTEQLRIHIIKNYEYYKKREK